MVSPFLPPYLRKKGKYHRKSNEGLKSIEKMSMVMVEYSRSDGNVM